MKRSVSIAAAVGATLLLGGSLFAASENVSPARQGRARAAEPSQTARSQERFQSVSLRVDNMSCAACPTIVERSLERVDGVIEADVSYRTKSARVTYDATKCSAKDLIEATAGMGYPSSVIE